ncbi:hypothetical protein M9434_001147 [Picochlorum sp. BPE23]|nr:hypothetical protein M9434_001147 [Picochlorum sp. BPE23]
MTPWHRAFLLLACGSVGYVLTRQIPRGAPLHVSPDKIKEISECITREMHDVAPWRDVSTYPSQYGQDAYIHETFEDILPRHGYFLEFGARDGVQHSNTYYFDRIFGYDGVLLEPVPVDYNKAIVSRERYGVSVYHGLACGRTLSTEASKKFVFDVNLEGLGMVADEKKDEKVKKLKDLASERNQKPHVSELTLRCLDVQQHVKVNGIDSLVIMSVDCEGCELDVLKDFDFVVTPVSILLVEINKDLEDILNILIPAGFIPVDARTSDIILVSRKFLEKSKLSSKFKRIMRLPSEDICSMLNRPEFMMP